MISDFAVLGVLFTTIISIGVPVGLLLWVRHKTGKGFKAAAIGALCFFVGALVLEQLLHRVIFTAFPLLSMSPLWYTVYGCLAAGIFEETARLIGLRWLCKKDACVVTGFAYGIGHGGIEAVLLVGVSYLMMLAGIASSNMQTMQALAGFSASVFWLAGIERIFAIILHIALSVLIWLVVTGRVSKWFYPLAILLHALTNVAAALYQTGVLKNLFAVEISLGICVAAVAFWVKVLFQKKYTEETLHEQC